MPAKKKNKSVKSVAVEAQKEKKNTKGHSPLKLVFFHILAFLTLYTSIVSYITLLFAYVNYKFPDELAFGPVSVLNTIRVSTSVLIVAWILYLIAERLINKEVCDEKTYPQGSGRKLLTYLTLFAATITIAVDLIVLIYNFYSGGFTTNFILKVVSVLVVAAIVFGYFRWDLHRDLSSTGSKDKAIIALVTAGLIASIALGFFIVGSPTNQRNIRFDEERISDLQSIQYDIITYWQSKDALPASLDDLSDSITGFEVPKDPTTDKSYKYTVLSDLSFELCATFKTTREFNGEVSPSYPSSRPYYDYKDASDNWDYKEGETCFTRTIDPDIYGDVTTDSIEAPVK